MNNATLQIFPACVHKYYLWYSQVLSWGGKKDTSKELHLRVSHEEKEKGWTEGI